MFNHVSTSNSIDISGVPSLSPVVSVIYIAVLPLRQPAGKGQAYVDDSNILALGLPVASSLAPFYHECLY